MNDQVLKEQYPANIEGSKEFNEANSIPQREIKPYAEVQIGEMAEESPYAGGVWEGGQIGKVLWKGTVVELKQTRYKDMLANWDLTEEEINDDFDLVVVDEIGHGHTLFNYNNDPSGCVVYK